MEEDENKPKQKRGRNIGTEFRQTEADQIRNKIYLKALEPQKDGLIDIQLIRALSFEGLPDVPEIRGKYWKILLGYLSCDPKLWEKEVSDKRKIYKSWADELIVNPHEFESFLGKTPKTSNESDTTTTTATNQVQKKEEEVVVAPVLVVAPVATKVEEKPSKGPRIQSSVLVEVELSEVSEESHPLTTVQGSDWHVFFENDKLFAEIDKDVKRTLPDSDYFTKRFHDEMLRILFLYAKLNPGVKYVQGMNEILAPLFYLFEQDSSIETVEDAEADTFWCFTNIMAEIRDHFIAVLDRSDVGINYKMQQMYDLLEEKDHPLWYHLTVNCQIQPQFFAFRWLSLLLTQEFEIHTIFHLWDALFADEMRFKFLLYVCVAMLVCVRDRIMSGDFTSNLKLLQRYPVTDPNELITKALWLHGSMGLPPVQTKHAASPSISSSPSNLATVPSIIKQPDAQIETDVDARKRYEEQKYYSKEVGGWLSSFSTAATAALSSVKSVGKLLLFYIITILSFIIFLLLLFQLSSGGKSSTQWTSRAASRYIKRK
eukprot:c20567_g1_i2.p1 GENE.c20567_g1_i2~~c20567_g1_i2.p1  ORF type:complete len:542 (-),score=163.71 c20567_g1_i2:203-1828(-)